MTKQKAPAQPSVDEAARVLAQREDELARAERDLVEAEASLPDIAEADDDAAYESASLAVERLRRAEVRAQKRVEVALDALKAAEAGEEDSRRRTLLEAGKIAASEGVKLLSSYREHAEAIVSILRKLATTVEPIRLANKSLPDNEGEIESDATGLLSGVELPAATRAGQPFWWRPDGDGFSPLNPRPNPRIIDQPVFAGGRWILPDDDDYAAAVAAEKSKPASAPVASRVRQPLSQDDVETRQDGSRVFKMPPCEWPAKSL